MRWCLPPPPYGVLLLTSCLFHRAGNARRLCLKKAFRPPKLCAVLLPQEKPGRPKLLRDGRDQDRHVVTIKETVTIKEAMGGRDGRQF